MPDNTYDIPQSAAAVDRWPIVIRTEGELDTVESVEDMLDSLGDALLTRTQKGILIGGPESAADSLHTHASVTHAETAGHAETADSATTSGSATRAGRLDPGSKINGTLFTGESDIVIHAHDEGLERVPNVYWGTEHPSEHSFDGITVQTGDLYVKVLV